MGSMKIVTRNTDMLIVEALTTPGLKEYVTQTKRMVEELGYSSKIIGFRVGYSSKIKYPVFNNILIFDEMKIAYAYRIKLGEVLKLIKPKIINFSRSQATLLQKKEMFDEHKTIISFDQPMGVNRPRQFFYHYLERRKLHQATILTPRTEYARNFLINKYKIDKHKIVVIPHAIDFNELRKHSTSDESYAISYCNPHHIPRFKGLDILILAWTYYNKMYNAVKKLVIAGIKRENALHFLKGKNVRIPKTVTFAGMLPKDKYLEIVAKSSFYISPSRIEEFGRATLEALALGKPVASTPTIGSLEIVGGIDKNLICSSFSPKDLVETMHYCESLRNEKMECVHACIKENIKKYDFHNVKEKFRERVMGILL